jgi:transcriptional regulator with XRE-family HTH domain
MTRGKDELQDFFEELGEWEDVLALARKKMIVSDLRAAMKARRISPSEMARRMRTSRQAVYRLLDPEEPSATLDTLARASAALNLDLEVRLVPRRPKRAPTRRPARGRATRAA